MTDRTYQPQIIGFMRKPADSDSGNLKPHHAPPHAPPLDHPATTSHCAPVQALPRALWRPRGRRRQRQRKKELRRPPWNRERGALLPHSRLRSGGGVNKCGRRRALTRKGRATPQATPHPRLRLGGMNKGGRRRSRSRKGRATCPCPHTHHRLGAN